MALLFCDGFDHYATPTEKWSVVTTNSPAIDTTAGVRGDGVLSFVSNTTSKGIVKSLTPGDVFIVGFGLYFRGSIISSGPLITFSDSLRGDDGDHCWLRVNTNGTVSMMRGLSTVLGTSVEAIPISVWTYIEVKVTISDAAGAYEVRFDSANVLSASGVDTKDSTDANVYSIIIGNNNPGGSSGVSLTTGYYINDLYICDDSGSVANNFLGPCRVDALYPSGNGNTSQWVGQDGNSTDNYLLVDETSPDSDTTYVESGTSTNKDTYAFGDISHTPTNIYGVQVTAYAKADDAGARLIGVVTRSAAADYNASTTHALGTSYTHHPTVLETDPATAAAWTKANLNAAEFGVRVV
jgi:hypothetical protein